MTLAERIDAGPLPVDEAIENAVQIAAGIEAAHESGIIHRDLKPANIKIDSDGIVKILDFGLARSDEGFSSTGVGLDDPTISRNQPQHSPTIEGAILGTAAYMSPEQARGRRVDKRTDIWSFGVLLYEMLVGSSPFHGETATDSIGAVLHKDIDLARLPPQTPANVRRVLGRCLVRDIGAALPRHRRSAYRTDALERRERGRARLGQPIIRPGEAADSSCDDGSGGVWWMVRVIADEPQAAVPMVSKVDIVVENIDSPLERSKPKISPDGSMIAYEHKGMIQLRRLDSFESHPMPGTEKVRGIFWSPDSRWIGYNTSDSIFKIAVNNGNPIKLTSEVHDFNGSTGGAWTADDRIVFSGKVGDSKGLTQISARGGKAAMLLEIDPERTLSIQDVTGIPGTNTVLYFELDPKLGFNLCAYNGIKRVMIEHFKEMSESHPVDVSTEPTIQFRIPSQVFPNIKIGRD